MTLEGQPQPSPHPPPVEGLRFCGLESDWTRGEDRGPVSSGSSGGVCRLKGIRSDLGLNDASG